jgi:alpha-ketoglutarate-dependent taurine dioxygenase
MTGAGDLRLREPPRESNGGFQGKGQMSRSWLARCDAGRNGPVPAGSLIPLSELTPISAAKSLHVIRDDCTGIEGMEQQEAEALMAALADHIVKPAFIYRHQWRPGDLLLWDNCTVQHRAIQDYDLPLRRLMHRTTMGGAVPS